MDDTNTDSFLVIKKEELFTSSWLAMDTRCSIPTQLSSNRSLSKSSRQMHLLWKSRSLSSPHTMLDAFGHSSHSKSDSTDEDEEKEAQKLISFGIVLFRFMTVSCFFDSIEWFEVISTGTVPVSG